MEWKLPRLSGTDQGKQFDRMNATEKATEFDASHADPNGYAERNFVGGEPTREAQYEAAREAQREEQEETPEGPSPQVSNEQKDRWALLRALWLLWCVGVTVGLTIAGEWLLLAHFSLGIVCVHGALAALMTIRDRRKEK